MTTPAVSPVVRRAGKGRQPAAVEQLRDLHDELEAHRQEAIALVDFMWPLLSRLEAGAREIGPLAYQTVMALETRLAHYERRHLDPEREPPAVAA